jgi:hypothetical protein
MATFYDPNDPNNVFREMPTEDIQKMMGVDAKHVDLPSNLFSYANVEYINGTYVYSDCTLLKATGKFPAGAKIEQISIPVELYLETYTGELLEKVDAHDLD